jgi:hypothetical protein
MSDIGFQYDHQSHFKSFWGLILDMFMKMDIHFEIIVEYIVIFSCLHSEETVKRDL